MGDAPSKRPENRAANGVKRDAQGRVVAGALNPGGRPRANAALRAKCRELDDELVDRLRQLAKTADSDAASIAAIRLLLAYGHGAPESKPANDDEERGRRPINELTLDELRAMARQSLADEQSGDEDEDPDDSDDEQGVPQ